MGAVGERAGPLTVLPDEAAIGKHVAQQVLSLLEDASIRRIVVGCPAGRTPRSTYRALGELAAARRSDLSRLAIVMMDEFLVEMNGQLRYCDPDALYSCRRFAEVELRQALNAGLSRDRQLPASQIHFPDPDDPGRFEDLIAELGGIDFFIIASGTSDGHVAFNPPGSALDSRTRIVELAATTRRDNMSTFPVFATLSEVPKFGVTVGLGTVVQHSKRVALLMSGMGKRAALQRLAELGRFDPSWPASVVFECRHPELVVDAAAAEGLGSGI